MEQKYIDRIYDSLTYNTITYCWESSYATNTWGYAKISIGKRRIRAVHRIFYQYIYGENPPDKPLVLHRCDNRKCCNPMHLYTGTHKDNRKDCVARNRYARHHICKSFNHSRGENHHDAKLTEKQVLEIRESKEIYRILAKCYNVGITAIYNIKTRKKWKHI